VINGIELLDSLVISPIYEMMHGCQGEADCSFACFSILSKKRDEVLVPRAQSRKGLVRNECCMKIDIRS
jgi:hypothetical protein